MSDTPKPTGHQFPDTTALLIHNQSELERELTAAQASLAHNKELHDRLLGEYASVDTEIRKAAVAVGITQEFVDGDSYSVPGPEELVECIVEKFTAAQAENAKLQERVNRLIVWGDELDQLVPDPPNRNCSCHISPPCSDCVDYGMVREVKQEWKEAKETQ